MNKENEFLPSEILVNYAGAGNILRMRLLKCCIGLSFSFVSHNNYFKRLTCKAVDTE